MAFPTILMPMASEVPVSGSASPLNQFNPKVAPNRSRGPA
jgi:hypothetical protein